MKRPTSKGGRRASLVLIFSLLLALGAVFGLQQLYVEDNSYVQPEQGGTYSEGLVGTLLGMNPLLEQRSSAEEDVVSLIYSGLTKYDPRQQKIVPDLATFESNSKYTEFTFRLREDAAWHDGMPVTADDVVFTYELIQNPDFPNNLLKAPFANVVVEKITDYEVKFTLPNSYSFFPTITTIGLLPKHLWESVAIEEFASHPLNDAPVGTGPYKLQGQLKATGSTGGSVVTLERFDEYYGEIPYLEKVVLNVYATDEEMLDKRNGLSGLRMVPYDAVDELEQGGRFSVIESFLPKYFAIFLNQESGMLQSKKTRQALQLAMNRENLLAGHSFLRSINSPFLQRDTEDWKIQYYPERAKGALFEAGWKMPSDEQVERYKQQIEKAYYAGTGAILEEEIAEEPADSEETTENETTATNEAETPSDSNDSTTETTTDEEAEDTATEIATTTVIDERGITTVESSETTTETVEEPVNKVPFEQMTVDGQRAVDLLEEYKQYRVNDKGERLTLHLVTIDSPTYLATMAHDIADNWREVGVDVDLEVQSNSLVSQVIYDRDYDVILIGQELGYDRDVFAYWHSSSAKRSGFNLSNFKNDQVDKLLEQLRSPKQYNTVEEGEEARLDLVSDISAIFREEVPAIFLFQQKGYFAVDNKLQDVSIKNIIKPKDRFAYISKWYERTGKQLKQDFTFTNFWNWIIKNILS